MANFGGGKSSSKAKFQRLLEMENFPESLERINWAEVVRIMPKRKQPVKRRATKPRRGPLRDRGFLRFLHVYGVCVACQPSWRAKLNLYYPTAYCDPMHGPVNGLSSKGPDNECVPGCRAHHKEQHEIGWPAFEAKYHFDRKAKAAEWWAAYEDRKR